LLQLCTRVTTRHRLVVAPLAIRDAMQTIAPLGAIANDVGLRHVRADVRDM
jgi:hypothetical protein